MFPPHMVAYFERELAQQRATQCTLTYLEGSSGNMTNGPCPFSAVSSPRGHTHTVQGHTVKSHTYTSNPSPLVKGGVSRSPGTATVVPKAGGMSKSNISLSGPLDVPGPRVQGGAASIPITTEGQHPGSLPTVHLPRAFIFPYQRLRWRLYLYWMDCENGASKVRGGPGGPVAALELCQILEVPGTLAAQYPECKALRGRWFRRINEALTVISTTVSRCAEPPSVRHLVKEKVRADWGACVWDDPSVSPASFGRSTGVRTSTSRAGKRIPPTGERMSRYRDLVSVSNQLVRKRPGCISNAQACLVEGKWCEPASAIRHACLQLCEKQGPQSC